MGNKISVIIATYQAESWIRPCLDSVLLSDVPVSVYIVDNASTDATTAIIQKEYGSKVFLHVSSTNLGFGKANNIAIKQAYQDGAAYFFLLNQDATVAASTFRLLAEVFTNAATAAYGVLSPLHLNGTGNALDYGFDEYLKEGNPAAYQAIVSGLPEPGIIDLPFVNAAGWMISRNCLEKVGLFNPLFFHYGEDDNYGDRLAFHRLKIGVVPNALLWHHRSPQPLNAGKTFRRQLFIKLTLLQLSHPGNTFTLQQRKMLYAKQAIKKLITGKLNAAIENLERLSWLRPIDKMPVADYRQRTLHGGKVFFENTDAFKAQVL